MLNINKFCLKIVDEIIGKLNCSPVISKKEYNVNVQSFITNSIQTISKNTDCFTALYFVIYFALAVKIGTMVCCLLDQLIRPFYNKKTYTKV